MSSIRDQIVTNLVDAISGMSQGAGYAFDWKRVYTFNQSPEDVIEFPSAIIVELPEQVSTLVGAHQRTLSIAIEGVLKTEFSEAGNPMSAAHALIADLENVVLDDPTRGGAAIDTRIVSNEPTIGDSARPLVWARVFIEIIYQTSPTDPGARP